jgi:class 3 adenylate cyclase
MDLSERFDMRYARTADGSHIGYAVGQSDDADRWVVFLGSSFGSVQVYVDVPIMSMWPPAFLELGNLVMVDLRGVGLSDPRPADFTVEARVDELIAVLDDLSIDAAILVGIDVAASLALLFAARHPDRVAAVVAFGPALRRLSEPGEGGTMTRDAHEHWIEELTSSWGSGRVTTGLVASDRLADESFVRMIARIERSAGSPASMVALERLHASLDLTPYLPDLVGPILLLERQDIYTRFTSSVAEIARRVPHARHVVLSADQAWTRFDDIRAEMTAFATGRSAATDPDRVLTTVVFSDIVGSTKLATRMGDRAWTHLVERHDQLIRDHVGTLGGRVVKSTGDGALIVIDSPSRAIRCALGLAKSLQQLGVPSRFGVHVGEVEVRGDDIGGVAVHLTARIASVAGAGEVATSEVVPAVVSGSEFRFTSLGRHSLRGISGEREIFVVARA